MTSDELGRLSEELAALIGDTRFDELAPETIERATKCVIDTVGVTIAGANAPPIEPVTQYLELTGSGGPGSIIGQGSGYPLADAALANGLAGHCLDYDDSVIQMICHPSVPLIVPMLAVSEIQPVSGRDMIAAYVAGYEVMATISRPIMPAHYNDGWHATSTLGTFGAAATTAKLRGLDAEATRNALNIAASMPSGIRRNFGTMTKPLHAGHAARSGVTAALLAENGFSAHSYALTDRNGFLDVYRGESEPDEIVYPSERDGLYFDEYGVWRKKYASNGQTQAAVAVTTDLVEEHGLSAGNVEHVELTVPPLAVELLPYPEPTTTEEARYSMEYCVARTIAHGEPGIADYEVDAVEDPETRALFDRVDFSSDGADPDHPFQTFVRIELADGGSVEGQLDYPPGHPNNQMTDAEFKAKFIDGATQQLSIDSAEDVYDSLLDLSEVDDVGGSLVAPLT